MAREDPRDVVVMKKDLSLKVQEHGNVEKVLPTLGDLPAGSVVGTSSVRRGAQLRAAYPHLGNNVALLKLWNAHLNINPNFTFAYLMFWI